MKKYTVHCNYIYIIEKSSSNGELQWWPNIDEVVGPNDELLLSIILMLFFAFMHHVYRRYVGLWSSEAVSDLLVESLVQMRNHR